MAVYIHNSLSKQKEELVPRKGKTVNMYTCGVTVYDKCHIGHARSLYIFDVIWRYLEYRGYQVNFIRNITDIDDKIINRAVELNKSWEEVVNENINSYQKDLKDLDIRYDVLREPRATKNIPGMIEHIKALMDKGYAYEKDGDVYFSVRKFKDYGKLSGQSIEQMMEAVRIEKDTKKKDPLDFALWKKSKENEPFWDSPWGQGRPGWHIECSVMSLKHLDCETLDIHGGGQDLIFPHHENEIAQAEALTGKPFAKYWIHHGLLTINGQKMAKSLGNFVTIEDALSKYDANSLKLFFLSARYQSAVDYTQEKMNIAENAYKDFNDVLRELKGIYQEKYIERLREFDKGIEPELLFSKFLESMDDDFNTPKALSWLFAIVNWCKTKMLEEDSEPKRLVLSCARDYIEKMLNIFGVIPDVSDISLSEEVKKLLEERQLARKKKNFQRADELRDQLSKKGILVEDTKEGQKIKKI
ncbi:MAG: cysteine--tRNA ligase [Candidatus Omnitrophota bacterium]